MNLRLYIKYLFKYYKQNKFKLIISVICLTICFLAVEIVLSFASIIEHKSQLTFDKHFKNGNFILSSSKGIKFKKNGELLETPIIDSMTAISFVHYISGKKYRTVQLDSTPAPGLSSNFIVVSDKSLNSDLQKFCDSSNIKLVNSFFTDTLGDYKAILYNVSGTGNRFPLFSFKNQVSAFVLGAELSSGVGLVSRLLFVFSVIFTFYISLLYFQERSNEFGTLIIQGHTDKSLRIIFIDCIIQNMVSFIFSILILSVILYLLTDNGDDLKNAFQGIYYIIPYLPVMIILQMLLLLNRTINYASSFK